LFQSLDLRQFASMLRKRLAWWLALPVVLIVVASWSFSFVLQAGWLRRSLSARLTATFGRPVEVEHFGFTILGGPQFEADSVTVAEDPRFGQEYFLRADRLTARLRLAALLHGRMEFDRLSLSRPSLNLVRSIDGQWNVQTWLPPANAQMPLRVYGPPAEMAAHASQIYIDAGRINFKKASDKLPLALVEVSGSLNLQSGGRWHLDLQAEPMRAAVVLQKSGTLHLRGTVGGTSTRLQPADLRLNWESASLADAARLVRGTDYGLRGMLDADFAAHISRADEGAAASPWQIEGGLRLQGIHRWDLAGHTDNPALNVKLTAVLHPGESRLEMDRWLVEAPHSNLDGVASIDWSHGFNPDVRLLASAIGFPDLVTWSRAFFPSRTEDLDISGSASLEGEFNGWPLRIADLSVSSDGGLVRSNSGGLPPIRLGPVNASWSDSSLILQPVAVRLLSPALNRVPRGGQSDAVSAALFHIDGILGPTHAGDSLKDWAYRATISGQTARLQDVRAVLAAVGRQFAPSWHVEGPASMLLVVAGGLRPRTAFVDGQIDVHNLRLTNSAIDEPILVSAATIEFSPRERRVEIGGMQAFAGRWKGSLHKKSESQNWTFDLSADRLDLEQLGRGLAQNRQGLLYRLLPFGGSAGLSSQTEAAIARISAQGRLHFRELAIGASRLDNLNATADLEHGNLTLRRAQADLYGGRLNGEFRVQLGSELGYNFRGQVDRTDLSALAALTSITNSFGGLGSGEIAFSARGFGRQALLASLAGEGFLHVQNAKIELPDLPSDSADTSFLEIAGNRFRDSTVSFRVENGRIRVDPWLLSGRQKQLEIVGDIDFSRRLDLQLRSLSQPDRFSSASESAAGDDVWVLGGTLDAPQIIREERVSAGNQTAVRTGRR
jgi:AsmA-like C-terminal region/AsmA family